MFLPDMLDHPDGRLARDNLRAQFLLWTERSHAVIRLLDAGVVAHAKSEKDRQALRRHAELMRRTSVRMKDAIAANPDEWTDAWADMEAAEARSRAQKIRKTTRRRR